MLGGARLLCCVVGCVTDWQQETRGLCLLNALRGRFS
jgi:hypothetical protein